MQHLIMLVHIQMQQMVHELAPPICVLKFNLSLSIFKSLLSPLSTFLLLYDLSLFLSPFVINDHKDLDYSEN